jgi:hypothetical protein
VAHSVFVLFFITFGDSLLMLMLLLFPGVYTELKWEVSNPNESMDVVHFGIGAAVNYIVPLVNIGDTQRTRELIDRAGVTSRSPGDGAFTPYHGRRFRATRPIERYSGMIKDCTFRSTPFVLRLLCIDY